MYFENKLVNKPIQSLYLNYRSSNIVNIYFWVEDRVKGDYSKGSIFVLLIPETN